MLLRNRGEHPIYKLRVRIYNPGPNPLKRKGLNMKVAGVTGLEPAASGVTGQRSNQLSYTPSTAAKPHRSPAAKDTACKARCVVKSSDPDRQAGGRCRVRTYDLLGVNQTLSQLS